eukprot:g3336.t1
MASNSVSSDVEEEEESSWDPYKEDKALGKHMDIANDVYLYQCDDDVVSVSEKAKIKKRIMETMRKKMMGPMYKRLCEDLNWDLDQNLLDTMQAENEKKVKEFDATFNDAVENFGENEVLDAALAKADYLSSIGEKEKMFEAYELVKEKSFSRGQKIDSSFQIMRNAFFHFDLDLIQKTLKSSKSLVEEGGDWDRRNRRRVYEGVYLLSRRKIGRASDMFLSGAATFTSFELISYESLVAYAVLTSMIHLDRASLKEKVVTNSDILATIGKVPNLSELLHSFYECRYHDFFKSLVGIYTFMLRDRVMSLHASFFIRELRIRAYKQLLQSYQSVTLESMARTFGVSVSFLDKELSRFIGVKRLSAKIDKVAGIVVTNRPNAQNAQYQKLIKQGDALLSRVHRLTRVIRM